MSNTLESMQISAAVTVIITVIVEPGRTFPCEYERW